MKIQPKSMSNKQPKKNNPPLVIEPVTSSLSTVSSKNVYVHSHGTIAIQCQKVLINHFVTNSLAFTNIQLNINTSDGKTIESSIKKYDVRYIILTEGAGRIETQQRQLVELLKSLPDVGITYCILLLLLPSDTHIERRYLESLDDIIVDIVLYESCPKFGLIMPPLTTSSFVALL
jgi:hypothetical protein